MLFDKAYFEELSQLPPKKGGSYLIKKYPDDVEVVQVVDAWELFDIDTREDYAKALNYRNGGNDSFFLL